ncbi:MAG: T9SS type A sorting domain-containing protein, partial [Rhizobacter sp.]|nr:T9SS type A sorting domain-containing protein [Chlorobiales bacterium]
AGNAKLEVFNIIGQKVAVLLNERLNAGTYTASFNATKLSSGIYFYKLTAGQFVQTKKMMLVK